MLTLALTAKEASIRFLDLDASVVTVLLITLDNPESQMLPTSAVILNTMEKTAYSSSVRYFGRMYVESSANPHDNICVNIVIAS